MFIMELILLITIVVLVAVLLIETREYRQAREVISGLEKMITIYTQGFNALASTVQSIEKSIDKSVLEHDHLSSALIRHGALLEIHNRALNLDVRLISTIKGGDENDKVL